MKLENCKEKCFTFTCGCRGSQPRMYASPYFLVSFHFHSQTEPMAREHDDLFCHEPCSTKQAGEVGSPSSLEVYTPVPTHFSLGAPSEGIISLPGAPFGDQFFHIHTFWGYSTNPIFRKHIPIRGSFPYLFTSSFMWWKQNKRHTTKQDKMVFQNLEENKVAGES